jgi:hypothetical protein
MSWFKEEVESWDMVGRNVAKIPPTVDWEDDEDENGNEETITVPLTAGAEIDLVARDPNAELLKKLRLEAESALMSKE